MNKNKFLRTCVSCREAKEKKKLFRYVVWNNEIILDFYQKLEGRGFYSCKNLQCINNIASGKIKKNVNFNIDKILDRLKKNLIEDIISNIHILNKAGLIRGTQNKFIEEIKRGTVFKIIFIANDISDNSYDKIKNFINGTLVNLFNKKELGSIFGKERVNVIGVKNSDLSNGLIEKINTYLNIFKTGGL